MLKFLCLKIWVQVTHDKFISNELLKRGYSRSIEIIGEAGKNISNELKEKYQEIHWKKLAGRRNKIIHLNKMKGRKGAAREK